MNNISSDSSEIHRKKLRFRAWHRGTREMDLIIGSFADEHIPNMDEAELAQFEHMLNQSDPDLYNWYLGKYALPSPLQHKLMYKFLAHKLT